MIHIEITYFSPVEVEIKINTQKYDHSIFLLGTSHVSKTSVALTQEKMHEIQPDCICIELDEKRYDHYINRDKWKNIDLYKIFKDGKAFLLLINLILSSYQKRKGKELQSNPGEEFFTAIQFAEEKNSRLELVDRPVEITFKRAWGNCHFWDRIKLVYCILKCFFSTDQITEEEIEELKQQETLEHFIQEFAKALPKVKDTFIDERDIFLARSILQASQNSKKCFAVLGAGHLKGVIQIMQRIFYEPAFQKEEDIDIQSNQKYTSNLSSDFDSTKQGLATDQNTQNKKNPTLPVELKQDKMAVSSLEDLLSVPKKTKTSKLLSYLFSIVIIAIIISGFIFYDTEKALHGLGIWALGHSLLAGLAALLVAAHPLSILTAIITSPFTSLNPTVSVGFLTALVEVIFRKPQVQDLENLLDLKKWSEFKKNRIWHALIVFSITSLGGGLATLITLPWLTLIFSS